jgi:hypothetical protein
MRVMLDKVPVARILGFLMLATVVLSARITYEGYRTSGGHVEPRDHIRFALFGMVVALFTHTMTLFYFVGTGSRIKKVVREFALPEDLYRRTLAFKSRLFPWLTFTPLVTMAAFIVGGGAHTRVLPAWLHGGLALVALGMTLVTAVLAIRCIGDNVALIDDVDALLPEATGD